MEILLENLFWNKQINAAITAVLEERDFTNFDLDDSLSDRERMRKEPNYSPLLNLIEIYADSKAHGFPRPGPKLSYSQLEVVLTRSAQMLSDSQFKLNIPDLTGSDL